jgi:hypothetical protein
VQISRHNRRNKRIAAARLCFYHGVMGAERLATTNWDTVSASLTQTGFSPLGQILSEAECDGLITLYADADRFRSRIEMAQYRFGQGEYQYFRYPLPPLVEALRHALYPKLAPIANSRVNLLHGGEPFPEDLDVLLERCHQSGQVRPTPLMLRYGPGDFNCLHQDVYGELTFPFQVVFFLSEPGRDYSGGEFLLVETAPRAQAMGRALQPRQGHAVVITTRHRPAAGKRGSYRVSVRHGVSPVATGSRWTLGIIFHDAQ